MAFPRSGAALILALVLLSALLMLGLPFLYLQASSVSGTRSYGDQQRSLIGQSTARNAAIAIVAQALISSHTAPLSAATQGWTQWSSLTQAINPSETNPLLPQSFPAAASPDLNDGSISLSVPETSPLVQNPAGSTYLGALITDESGKLDPNQLSILAWGRLLAAVQITDWTDALVYPAPPTGNTPGLYQPSSDGYGQLAKALASLRPTLPQQRIMELEQLLLANPQTPANQPGGPWTKLRAPLSRTELARLRPYLTLHHLGPGRSGDLDLGTVIQTDVNPTTSALSAWVDTRSKYRKALKSDVVIEFPNVLNNRVLLSRRGKTPLSKHHRSLAS